MNYELPSNIEAETWLLGGILQDPKVMAQFAHSLNPDDFYLEKHRLIWQAMQNLQRDNRAIDIITVGAELKDREEFKSLFGSNEYLFNLNESVPSAANVDHYISLIAKASSLRKLIAASQKTIAEAFEAGADADETISSAMERLAVIASGSACATDEHLADVAKRVLDHISDRMFQGMQMGASTGFDELDRITGGLRPGELIITGARTGMGKTSFAMSVALQVAKTMPVKFFSLEVKEKQLAPRVLSFISQINMQRTLNAKISAVELQAQYQAVEELRNHNIYAEFKVLSIEKIISESHAFTARRGKGLIVIDHLHFCKTSEKNYENRNIELGKVTRALKEMAGNLDVPVLLLSQLNRDIDRAPGKDKRPKLSDLRDSGNIEQDADMVWFIHRPGYYDSNIDKTETEILVSKNRSGPTGEAKLYFDLNTTRFRNIQETLYEQF